MQAWVFFIYQVVEFLFSAVGVITQCLYLVAGFSPSTMPVNSALTEKVLIAEAKGNLSVFVRRTNHRSTDRKSTRLNSSHVRISYAVFCLKKKKKKKQYISI